MRKHGRYGHPDATMILLVYRHGLRASELCDLQWRQVGASLPGATGRQRELYGERRRERHLRRRATVLGIRSFRRDQLASLVDAVFCHAVMENGAEPEIPSRLNSGCPSRSQLIEKALET
jgi:integrase